MYLRNRQRAVDSRRSGAVLLAVLVVVVILTLTAYQFSDLMSAENRAADGYIRAAQAKALADSGVSYAAVMLSNTDAFSSTLGYNPYDNPSAFSNILAFAHATPRFQGRFSILSPLDDDDSSSSGTSFRYGVQDENAKINLNSLLKIDSSGRVAHDALMKLPGMTEDIVNAILDWIDTDDEPRASGAEIEHYGSLTPPYRTKNGPLDSLDEMLLIRGINATVLYGFDTNRNGVLDASEQDQSGMLNRGLSAYVTIYSRERNISLDGQPRIYLNDNDLNTLSTNLTNVLSEDMVTFILAARQYGVKSTQSGTTGSGGSSSGSGSTGSGATTTATTSGAITANGSVMIVVTATQQPSTSSQPAVQGGRLTRANLGSLTGGQSQRIASLFDLVNSYVEIPSQQPNQPATRYDSPLNESGTLREQLPLLLDMTTTSRDTEIPARVNVNTASREVLTALPGLAEADVQAILDHQPSPQELQDPTSIYRTVAWLLSEARLPAATLKTLERYVTAQSTVYRMQSVGHFDAGGPTARVEAVIDTNNGRPRIIYYRDITELGKGFDLQQAQ